MEKDKKKQKLEQLRRQLRKKQRKLQKYESLTRAREHVQRKIAEQRDVTSCDDDVPPFDVVVKNNDQRKMVPQIRSDDGKSENSEEQIYKHARSRGKVRFLCGSVVPSETMMCESTYKNDNDTADTKNHNIQVAGNAKVASGEPEQILHSVENVFDTPIISHNSSDHSTSKTTSSKPLSPVSASSLSLTNKLINESENKDIFSEDMSPLHRKVTQRSESGSSRPSSGRRRRSIRGRDPSPICPLNIQAQPAILCPSPPLENGTDGVESHQNEAFIIVDSQSQHSCSQSLLGQSEVCIPSSINASISVSQGTSYGIAAKKPSSQSRIRTSVSSGSKQHMEEDKDNATPVSVDKLVAESDSHPTLKSYTNNQISTNDENTKGKLDLEEDTKRQTSIRPDVDQSVIDYPSPPMENKSDELILNAKSEEADIFNSEPPNTNDLNSSNQSPKLSENTRPSKSSTSPRMRKTAVASSSGSRRRRTLQVLDFSFLDEDDDMYSQLKRRRARRKTTGNHGGGSGGYSDSVLSSQVESGAVTNSEYSVAGGIGQVRSVLLSGLSPDRKVESSNYSENHELGWSKHDQLMNFPKANLGLSQDEELLSQNEIASDRPNKEIQKNHGDSRFQFDAAAIPRQAYELIDFSLPPDLFPSFGTQTNEIANAVNVGTGHHEVELPLENQLFLAAKSDARSAFIETITKTIIGTSSINSQGNDACLNIDLSQDLYENTQISQKHDTLPSVTPQSKRISQSVKTFESKPPSQTPQLQPQTQNTIGVQNPSLTENIIAQRVDQFKKSQKADVVNSQGVGENSQSDSIYSGSAPRRKLTSARRRSKRNSQSRDSFRSASQSSFAATSQATKSNGMKSHDSPALHSQKTQQMSTHTANSAKDDDIKESDHSEPQAEEAAVMEADVVAKATGHLNTEDGDRISVVAMVTENELRVRTESGHVMCTAQPQSGQRLVDVLCLEAPGALLVVTQAIDDVTVTISAVIFSCHDSADVILQTITLGGSPHELVSITNNHNIYNPLLLVTHTWAGHTMIDSHSVHVDALGHVTTDCVRLETPVHTRVHSVHWVKGVQGAVVGVADRMMFVWDAVSGKLLCEAHLPLISSTCAAVYSQKGLLFLKLQQKDGSESMVAVNPLTARSCRVVLPAG